MSPKNVHFIIPGTPEQKDIGKRVQNAVTSKGDGMYSYLLSALCQKAVELIAAKTEDRQLPQGMENKVKWLCSLSFPVPPDTCAPSSS